MSACAKHRAAPVKGYRACPGCEVEALRTEVERMKVGLLKIIEMNRQEAEDRYGWADKAESWSCVRVCREALAAAAPPKGKEK